MGTKTRFEKEAKRDLKMAYVQIESCPLGQFRATKWT